jgi:PKD repeat protein
VFCGVFALPATSLSYEFGEPGVRQAGPEKVEFDYSAQKCDSGHIPDAPVRAFRDSTNRVQMILAHESSRRLTGPDLDSLSRDCAVLMSSHLSADPARWDDREWITAPYTTDGQTVRALVHEELQGWNHTGLCSTTTFNPGCWYNAITLATSTNSGNTYTHATPPAQHVASSPWTYVEGTGPYGLFQPSNIVYSNGWYYSLLQVEAHLTQRSGACLIRTQDLSNADSWHAWDGSGFNVQFIDPYAEPTEPPEAHVCEPVSEPQINKMVQSLTWSSYFKKWLLVGTAGIGDPNGGPPIWGAFYSLSDDLVNWSQRKLLFASEVLWTYTCGDDNPTLFPVVLDPDSGSRNFETSDQQAYLYFTRYNYSNCTQTLDRDLVRIPIEFSDQVVGGPIASFTATPDPAPTGEAVVFDATGSSDSNGLITTYEWDLDDDGTFEIDTGAVPTASRSYPLAGQVTVWLRVTDNDGNRTRTTRKVTVQNRTPAASFSSSPNPSLTGQAVTFDGSASSDPDGTIANYKWDLDGNGSYETDTGSSATATRTYSGAGTVSVRLKVTDDAGATGETTGTQTVENSGPAASFSSSPNPSLTGQAVTFDGSASSDPDGTIANYRWDLDGNGSYETDTGSSATASRTYLSVGTVTVGLEVTDDAGATGETTRTQTVENGPPTASFSSSPNPSLTGEAVTFDGSASSDSNGSVTRYEWDLDGNGSFETEGGASPTATRTYSGAGTVTVRLRVTDDAGATGETTGTQTILNRAPTASFTAAPNPSVMGQAVTFDGSASSDPDGTIANYKWDLDGNGSYETDTGSSAAATRTYSSAGTVNVGLKVTDGGGASGETTRTQTVKYAKKFNFQPSAAAVPSGYTADNGAAYSSTRGYGWFRQATLTSTHTPLDLTRNTFDRNKVSDQRLDTLIFMQSKSGSGMNKTPGAWEVAVPNGTYTVTLSVGDAAQLDSTHRINVEGVNAINNFKPTSLVRFASATHTIAVADGRLTIDAVGGTNTKLNYADVTGL